MSTSQNGWAAVESSAGLAPLRWVTGRVVPGDVHAILDRLGARFDGEVEAIDKASSWGWAHRPVRGAVALSNHASGTAVDFNAPRHPLGRSGTFSSAQVRALRPILAELAPVVRWGGDYPGRKDEMHFEIVGTPAQVAAVAARLRGSGGASIARPTPPTSEEDDMTPDQDARLSRVLELLTVPGQPYGYPEAISNAVRSTEERVKGVRSTLDVPGMPFAYPAATHNAVGGLVGQVAALQAAVVALAAGTGADPEAILAAAREGAEQALKGITVTVQAGEAR